MIKPLTSLSDFLTVTNPSSCFVDTSILFSASHTPDPFNTESEKAFESINKFSIPIFTNINVRSEFLENHRRVMIPDSLIDFLEQMRDSLDELLINKLTSHRTSYQKKLEEEKSAKFDVNQIKKFKNLLSANAINGWDSFCSAFLDKRLELIWPETEKLLNLNFISVRSNDHHPFLNSLPEWEQAVSLMGRYGIASNDSMILNMFLCSKIPILLTADLEMAEVLDKEAHKAKTVFVPDSIYNL